MHSLTAIITACLMALPAMARAEPVSVFAASSLKDALDAIASDWQAAGHEAPTVSYGGSPAMARQIIEGAPADLFISASPEWMDAVDAAGLVQPGTQRNLLGNTLVLIAHGKDATPVALDSGLDLPAMLGSGMLAMAMVDVVPAGVYGKQALTSLGQWDRVEPHVAQTENVRAALALVATGDASMGIVYGSDAVAARAASEPVSVIATFPPDSHAPITYPAALIRDTPEARAFLDHLSQSAASAVFTAQGFTVLP